MPKPRSKSPARPARSRTARARVGSVLLAGTVVEEQEQRAPPLARDSGRNSVSSNRCSRPACVLTIAIRFSVAAPSIALAFSSTTSKRRRSGASRTPAVDVSPGTARESRSAARATPRVRTTPSHVAQRVRQVYGHDPRFVVVELRLLLGCGANGVRVRLPYRRSAPRWPVSQASAATASVQRCARGDGRREQVRRGFRPRTERASCALSASLPRGLRPEHEVHRPEQAQARPQEVQLERLPHVEHRERHEHAERDDLLQDLQLRELQGACSRCGWPAPGAGTRTARSPSSPAPPRTTARSLRFLRCAYQANVMNTFEQRQQTCSRQHHTQSGPSAISNRLQLSAISYQLSVQFSPSSA